MDAAALLFRAFEIPMYRNFARREIVCGGEQPVRPDAHKPRLFASDDST